MAAWLTIVDSIEISPILTALPPNDFTIELGTVMSKIVDRANKSAQKMGSGNWVLQSHALATVGDRLVVSLLFSR